MESKQPLDTKMVAVLFIPQCNNTYDNVILVDILLANVHYQYEQYFSFAQTVALLTLTQSDLMEECLPGVST